MSKRKLSEFYKKADIYLLIAVLALSVLGFAVLRKSASASSEILVTVDGKDYGRYPLNKDGTYTISTDYGYNTIEVRGGQVWISDANCSGQDCMHFGKASREGQVILCLPHKLSVRITGVKGGTDAISY